MKRRIVFKMSDGVMAELVEEVPGSTYLVSTDAAIWEVEDPQKMEWVFDAFDLMLKGAL